MSHDDRFYNARELTALGTFLVLSVLIGVGAYQIGYHRISGVKGGGASMSAAPDKAPINGQSLYASNCAGCHGAAATGAVGPTLVPAGTWALNEFKNATLHGDAPGGRKLSVVMPRFAESGFGGEAATDEQVEAIHAYVQSLP